MADLATIQAQHPEWNVVAVTPAPGGGTWAVGADGGVFALEGAAFDGAYTTLAPSDRQGDRTFTGITATGSGYTLTSNHNESYAFNAPSAPPPPPAPAPAPAAPAPGQGTADQNSALAAINSNLALLGLPASLAPWAWGEIQKGVDPNQVLLDLEGTPEFQKRFPAIAQLRDRAAGGEQVHVPTPAEYKQFEDTTAGLMKAAGLPAGFYDSPDDFTKFILNQTSPKEISDRIQGAQAAVYSTPPEARDAMQRYYGMTPGDATAMWLDPTKAVPLLQNQRDAGLIGGRAQSSGFGMLSKDEAEKLQGGGLTDAQAAAGFGTLATESQLFADTAGEHATGESIGRGTQLSSLTGDATAQAEIERRRANRNAAFTGGGGAGGPSQGSQGIGSSTS